MTKVYKEVDIAAFARTFRILKEQGSEQMNEALEESYAEDGLSARLQQDLSMAGESHGPEIQSEL